MKSWLYTLVFLGLLTGGCGDMDMSGFGYISQTMQAYPAPRRESSLTPLTTDKSHPELAQLRNPSSPGAP